MLLCRAFCKFAFVFCNVADSCSGCCSRCPGSWPMREQACGQCCCVHSSQQSSHGRFVHGHVQRRANTCGCCSPPTHVRSGSSFAAAPPAGEQRIDYGPFWMGCWPFLAAILVTACFFFQVRWVRCAGWLCCLCTEGVLGMALLKQPWQRSVLRPTVVNMLSSAASSLARPCPRATLPASSGPCSSF